MSDYNLGRVRGADGRGIVSIEKTSTSGLIDTYTITYSDGTTSTFVVKNGEDGSAITIDTELSSSSTNPVQNKVIKTALDTKSNSSHNHDSRYYTETEMDTKLSGKANTSHTHNISDVSNLQSALDGKADGSDIPTKTSDLTNDGDGSNVFVKDNDSRLSDARTPTSHAHGQITADGALTGTPVIVASDDKILITDASDNHYIKRVSNLLASHIKDGVAHSNIGSSASATQADINTAIDTKIGDIEDLIGDAITYINQ